MKSLQEGSKVILVHCSGFCLVLMKSASYYVLKRADASGVLVKRRFLYAENRNVKLLYNKNNRMQFHIYRNFVKFV